MWRKDGQGEIDLAIDNSDGETLGKLIQELVDMNQDFLTKTSQRFADEIAQPRQ